MRAYLAICHKTETTVSHPFSFLPPLAQSTLTLMGTTPPITTNNLKRPVHKTRPGHRHLAARLIKRLPTCPIPEIARLGRTLRKWKEALDAYFDTDGASNGPTEAINGHYRTWQTHRQRLPQPHQLQTPNAPHRRRPRRLHPHSTMKSPQTRRERGTQVAA